MSDYANMRAELDAANKRIAELEAQIPPGTRRAPEPAHAHADATKPADKPAHHENEHERGKR
jgi:hypothetical protein